MCNYKWRDVVKVAFENEQGCEYVLKAASTYLSGLKEPFKHDWIPVEDVLFHTENMDREEYDKHVLEHTNDIAVMASENHRRLVGLQMKKSQRNDSLTFDVTTLIDEDISYQ